MTAAEIAGRPRDGLSDAMVAVLRWIVWVPGDPDMKAPRITSFYACYRRSLLSRSHRGWAITELGRRALASQDGGGA